MPRFALLLCLLPLHTAASQTAGGAEAPTKNVVATRIVRPAIHVDGRLDDEAWLRAHFVADFVQKEPVEGAEPTERTAIAFLYDEDALYVGARMYSADPSAMQAMVGRRDRGAQSQSIQISLDTYHDRRTAYSLGITASGVRLDWYHPSDREDDFDTSWDPVWEGKVHVDSLGWTAEMRIPFSQLRFNDQPSQVWGLNVRRWIPGRNEDVFWIPVPRNGTGWSSRMGTLSGIEGVRPGRRVELSPYVAGDATLRGAPDANDPFDTRGRTGARAGADLKMGLGPNFTLDATVNPDFGQVEADPAVVNLSAFEVFFGERRPFFTEGSQLLRGGGSSYFYSRRIGQEPAGDVNGDFVDPPRRSTILGAAKFTGRSAHGLSVGALSALTAREYARSYDAATDTFGSTEVAPVTGFGVVRLQQEFGADASTAGFILTGVRRDLTLDEPLATTYNRSAFTGGADWNLRFGGGTYEVGGSTGFSYVEGDTTRILALQRSSARYFQRPDAEHLEIDPSRRALTGFTGSFYARKNSGRHWLGNVEVSTKTPDFELNDAGRQSTADDFLTYASVSYRETRPGPLFRAYEIALSTEGEFDTDFQREFTTIRADAYLTWKNFWQTTLTAWNDFRGQSTTLTRGGPSMQTPAYRVIIARFTNRGAATTRWNGRVYYGITENGGLTYRLSGSLSIRPGPRWEMSLAPNYLRDIDPTQYVTTLDGGPEATFDARYVFAVIDRSTWLAQIRLNYALTPDLTLELYAEPFAASGRYHDHGELTAAGTSTVRTYGTDGTSIRREPDGSRTVTDGDATFSLPDLNFNVRSFRSNVVLRWEWRQGSVLYLVWQQDRSTRSNDGRLVRPLSPFDAVTATGDSYFAVKMSYWIN